MLILLQYQMMKAQKWQNQCNYNHNLVALRNVYNAIITRNL